MLSFISTEEEEQKKSWLEMVMAVFQKKEDKKQKYDDFGYIGPTVKNEKQERKKDLYSVI